MLRLHRRYERMTHRGVLPQKAVVAIARELADLAQLTPRKGRFRALGES
jgi:hypothetical protein